MTITITLVSIMFAGAVVSVVFLALGFVLGVGTRFAEEWRARDCLNCKRRITHNGLSVDGSEYEVALRIVRGAEKLGKAAQRGTGL